MFAPQKSAPPSCHVSRRCSKIHAHVHSCHCPSQCPLRDDMMAGSLSSQGVSGGGGGDGGASGGAGGAQGPLLNAAHVAGQIWLSGPCGIRK